MQGVPHLSKLTRKIIDLLFKKVPRYYFSFEIIFKFYMTWLRYNILFLASLVWSVYAELILGRFRNEVSPYSA